MLRPICVLCTQHYMPLSMGGTYLHCQPRQSPAWIRTGDEGRCQDAQMLRVLTKSLTKRDFIKTISQIDVGHKKVSSVSGHEEMKVRTTMGSKEKRLGEKSDRSEHRCVPEDWALIRCWRRANQYKCSAELFGAVRESWSGARHAIQQFS